MAGTETLSGVGHGMGIDVLQIQAKLRYTKIVCFTDQV